MRIGDRSHRLSNMCAVAMSLVFGHGANADFIGVIVQTDPALSAQARTALADTGVPYAETAQVARVYAAFDGPGDGAINTVIATSFVNLRPSGPVYRFYQHPNGSTLPPDSTQFGDHPALQYDSFGTIGALTMQDGATIIDFGSATESAHAIDGDWANIMPQNALGAASVDLGDGLWGALLFQITVIEICPDTAPNESGAVAQTDFIRGGFSIFTQGQGQAVEHLAKFPLEPSLGLIASSPHDDGAPVNGADLAALLAWWGPAEGCAGRADINFDGVVDGADLATLLSHWSDQ